MSLVNELIKDLLPEQEYKKTVAVYGGGFKPPTKGHFKVVKQAIEENPDIDEFIINIGGKERDGVTPEEAIQIWDIYKQYLPVSANINIQYSSTPPIKATYDYAKNHPDEEVLFILGAREGNDDDFKDISARTKSLDKYPNLNLRTIVTQGGVSGTAAREAGKISSEKLKRYLPDELSDEEVEQVYQMISDKLNENISESKQVGTLYHYTSADGLKGILQSNSINASEEEYLGNDLYFVSFTRNKNFHKKGSAFDVSMDYRIALDGNKLSNKYKITPFAYIPGWNYKDNWEYDWLDDEPESVVRDFLNATGDYDEQEERINFKKPGSSITDIKDYILKIDKVSELTEGRKKKPDPKKGTGKKPKKSGRRLYTDEDPKDTVGIKFSTRQDIVDTLNKKSFKAKSHARQSQIINLIHQRVRAALGRTKDPKKKAKLQSGFKYITKRKEASKKKTQRLKKKKLNEIGIDLSNYSGQVLPGDVLRAPKGFPLGGKKLEKSKQLKVIKNSREGVNRYKLSLEDSDGKKYTVRNFQMDGEYKGKKLPKWGLIRKSKKNLKEQIDSSQFDFAPHIASLTQHMMDNGLNLEPLPKIQMIHDDYENGEDLFGKTAYYAPATNLIVLYTYGRHPKDILRSYAHELIHVHQNMEDRLHTINTTDVNQDDHLEQLEREAYETGNIMFRSWTDSLTGNKLEESVKQLITEKKKKDPFGLNAYALELAKGMEEQVSDYKVYLDMDGVLADFDQRFKDISGMAPKEFENKYGKKAFWNLIDEDNKISFWVGIKPMPGAAALVNAVKKYNYELLTSPSSKKQSYLGKILWVRNHSDILGGKPRINFKRAKEKHEVKPELSKTDILIDDREDTIGRWNAAGGTGIVYKNIGQVLNDLKKLGL